LVEDIGLDIMDMENLDFTDLIVGEEEEEVPMENVDSVDGILYQLNYVYINTFRGI
jgi:hypothetical protein